MTRTFRASLLSHFYYITSAPLHRIEEEQTIKRSFKGKGNTDLVLFTPALIML